MEITESRFSPTVCRPSRDYRKCPVFGAKWHLAGIGMVWSVANFNPVQRRGTDALRYNNERSLQSNDQGEPAQESRSTAPLRTDARRRARDLDRI
jgi:hypothetical protein